MADAREEFLKAVALHCAEKNETLAVCYPDEWDRIFEAIFEADIVVAVVRTDTGQTVFPVKAAASFNALLAGAPMLDAEMNGLFVRDEEQARQMAAAFEAVAPTTH